MNRKLTFLLFALVLAAVAQASAAQDHQAFVVLNAENYAQVRQVVAQIEASGGHVRHIFPNSALVADGVDASLADHALVSEVKLGEFAPDGLLAAHGRATWLAASAWLGSQEAEEGEIRPETPVEPIESDVLERPAPLEREDIYATSEYMAGTVAVGLVLPECTGGACTEAPWTPGQLADVFAEVVGAMDWWVDRAAESGVLLSFVYDQGAPVVVPTEYEPIGMNFIGQYCGGAGDHFIWVEDVLHSLGYAGECWDVAYDYLGGMKDAYGTDWAFAAFVVNSLVDTDGLFADGRFALAWLGGPFFVMTYDNNGYGIQNMDAVAAHETGHIFWARDQYGGVPCTSPSGYLNVENQNSDLNGGGQGGCLVNEVSIMRGGVLPYIAGAVDPYARGQIGWWDTDEDGLQDVIDTRPTVALAPFSPDPTEQNELLFSGHARDVPCPNSNPASWNLQTDISINEITAVQFRVDGDAWAAATAVDGAFDDTLEFVTFTTDPLDPGTHVIEVTAVNSVGNHTEATARDTVTVVDWVGVPEQYATVLRGNHPNPFNPTTTIRYELAERGTVTLSVHSISGRLVRVLEKSVSKGAGPHRATWDGRDDRGREVASGVYFYCLDLGGEVAGRKMILLK